MKRFYKSILNLGIDKNMPFHEFYRVRFANFLQLVSQLFFIFYFFVGYVLHSTFLMVIPILMMAAGIISLLMNKLQFFKTSRTFFLCTFSLLLFSVCNVLNIGSHFIVFYFPVFVSFALYYDIRNDFPDAALSLFVTLCAAIGSLVIPPQVFIGVNIDESWMRFIRNLNYFMAFAVTFMYIVFIISHISTTGNKLYAIWKESQRQRLELTEAKKKAESADLAKSRFLSNMSHELRTPLNGIIGTVNILLQEPHMPDQAQHYSVLKFSSEHMLGLINDVLDFSKIEAGKMELYKQEFNLTASLEKLKAVFEKRFEDKGLAFSMSVDSKLDRQFEADETKIMQVLTNLIGNAFKFTDQGGVDCVVKMVSSTSQQALVLFSVKDTGIGMTAEKQEHIFNAFDQGESSTKRRYGGTGLGLTISRNIVEILGGQLKVTSEENRGSHFYFQVPIPLCQSQLSFVNEKKVSGLESLKGLRILVAEDSTVNMMITKKFLERWGVVIHEAINGQEAVQLFKKNEYDLLLIDLDMPVMDGYEALEQIKIEGRQVPAIAFTAAVLPHMKDYLSGKGFSDFLQKPFRPEDLHKKIAQFYTAEEVK